MPGEQENPQGDQSANFDAQAFLDELGVGALAAREVRGHEGGPVSLAVAITECMRARGSIAAAVSMAHQLGGEDVNVVDVVDNYLGTMEQQAQQATPEFEDDKKKEPKPSEI